jgi:hypothetical protein
MKQTNKVSSKVTNKASNKQTNKQINKQTNKQTEIGANIHTSKQSKEDVNCVTKSDWKATLRGFNFKRKTDILKRQHTNKQTNRHFKRQQKTYFSAGTIS